MPAQDTNHGPEHDAKVAFLISRSQEVSVSNNGTIFTTSPWARGAQEGWEHAIAWALNHPEFFR